MKCSNCNKETDEPVFLKRMVQFFIFEKLLDEDKQDILTYGIEHTRSEFLKMVKSDVKNNENEGEWFSCKDCFKEI